MSIMLHHANDNIQGLDKEIGVLTKDIEYKERTLESDRERLADLKAELEEWKEVRTIFQAKKAQEETTHQ